MQVNRCCSTTDFTDILFSFSHGISLSDKPFTFHKAPGEVTFLSLFKLALYYFEFYCNIIQPCSCCRVLTEPWKKSIFIMWRSFCTYGICATSLCLLTSSPAGWRELTIVCPRKKKKSGRQTHRFFHCGHACAQVNPLFYSTASSDSFTFKV